MSENENVGGGGVGKRGNTLEVGIKANAQRDVTPIVYAKRRLDEHTRTDLAQDAFEHGLAIGA